MTQGPTPPGWYDDGNGARRWWDGASWTQNVTPNQPAGPSPALSATRVPAALPPALAHPAEPRSSAIAGTWPARYPEPPQTTEPAAQPPAEPGPRTRAAHAAAAERPSTRNPALIAAGVAALLVAGIGGYVIGQSTAGSTDVAAPQPVVPTVALTPSVATTAPIPSASPTASATVAVRARYYGVAAATLARKAGCEVVPSPTPTASTLAVGPKPTGSVDCTINGTSYQITTWKNVADQNAAAVLIRGIAPYLPPGRHYYASGAGYTGFDTNDTLEGAQTLVAALGGKPIEIVRTSPAPTP